MWIGYRVIWALGNEGLDMLDVGVTSWGYSILDIIAKYAFTIILVLYDKKEPEAITAPTNSVSASARKPWVLSFAKPFGTLAKMWKYTFRHDYYYTLIKHIFEFFYHLHPREILMCLQTTC